MIAKTLALVNRALRSDARDLRPHLVRFALAAVLIGLMVFVRNEQRGFGAISAPGRRIFSLIIYMNYWFIMVAGGTFFATAITEEKEERTLGLLKLAGLSGLSILTGKWLPRLVGASLVLAIQIPFMQLCVTLGGLTWDQVLSTYIALFAHLVFVGCLGLLCSVVMRSIGGACLLALAIQLLLLTVPFLALVNTNWVPGIVAAGRAPGDVVLAERIFGPILEFSIAVRLSEILEVTYASSLIGWQIPANFLAGGCLFALGWLLFARCTENEGEAAGESLFRRSLKFARLRPQSRRASRHAIIGKDFHELTWGWWGITFRFAAYLLTAMLFLWANGSYAYRDPARVASEVLGGTALSMLVIEISAVAARVFRFEITGQTWSTLCMLPRSVGQVAGAKLLGGLLALIPGLALIAVAFMIDAQPFWEVLRELDDEGLATKALLAFLGLAILLAWHVTALISISGRWGVWPVAIALGAAIPIVLVVTITTLMRPTLETAVFLFLLCPVLAGLAVKMNFVIRAKLERLAGE